MSVLRTAVVAIAMFALGFFSHQLLLDRDYGVIEPIMRDKADTRSHMPFAFLSTLCFSGAFVWIPRAAGEVPGWGRELASALPFGRSRGCRCI